MTKSGKELRDWIIPRKPGRLLLLLAVAVGIFGADCLYRRWGPDMEITTEHYVIYSSAAPEQTHKIGEVVEALYAAYRDTFSGPVDFGREHARLKLKLFKDRAQFRRSNRGVGWAEAFYRYPHCYAYYPADETSPYHWMVHEAVHQLNHEVAKFDLAKWADEGIAEYFSTSEIDNAGLHTGKIDRHTYPIWWLGDMELSGDIKKDIERVEIIPLAAIVSGSGGPDIDEYFNLYYIHWWSLSHFLFHYENGAYRQGYMEVIRAGGTVGAFEKHIGPLERIQQQWYEYLCELLKGY